MKAFTVTEHFGVWQEKSQTWSRELKNVVIAVFEDDAIIQTASSNEFEIFYNNEWVEEGSKDFPWEKMPWE